MFQIDQISSTNTTLPLRGAPERDGDEAVLGLQQGSDRPLRTWTRPRQGKEMSRSVSFPRLQAAPEAERGDGVRSPQPVFFFILITAGVSARLSHSGG